MIYTVNLNINQLAIVQNALDLYSRIGMGQYDEILDRRFDKYSQDPDERMSQTAELQCRGALRYIKRERLGLTDGSYFGIASYDISDEFRVAWDMQQVIRNKFWKERCDGEEDSWSLASSVDRTSHECLEMITITSKAEEEYKGSFSCKEYEGSLSCKEDK